MAVQTKTIDYADGNIALEGYFAWDNAALWSSPWRTDRARLGWS